MPRTVQLNLPPSPLPNASQDEPVRTISSGAEPLRSISSQESDALAAHFFDEALRTARVGKKTGISNKEVAALTGVSESLVTRWRSPNHREQPSFGQMLRLPAAFHIALHRLLNHQFGFGQQAIARLLDAVGDLALAVER